ncbi:MAG: glycosyltransferase family 4 protein, partial [Pedobacter sp.]|nr:glycosyltransferase family 4 protein [Pedobacter sp.]
ALISQLSDFFHQNQYLVYTSKVKQSRQITAFFSDQRIQLKFPDKSSSSILWRSFGIKRQLLKDQIDIYHGLSNEIPFGMKSGKIKTVVTIHDLIFFRFPKNYKFIDRQIYNLKSRYACKNADLIIAISEKTKQDIIEFYQVAPEKIKVVYQTCDDSFKQQVKEEFKSSVRQKYSLPEKYILNVGTIEPRKNLLLLVQAMENVQPDHQLVVVGKSKSYAQLVRSEIKKLGLEDRVIFLKDIPFTDLPAIYQMASVFVYPSFYEGFGIPIIEALYGNIPVVAATGSCLEEAGGQGSIYIDPKNAVALANAINSILSRPELAKEMKEKGLAYVQQFNTAQVAAELMDCYLNIPSKM